MPRWEQALVTAELEHTVSEWKELTKEYQPKRKERDGARVLHFAVFYLYLRHTTTHGSRDVRRNRGEGAGVNVCVYVLSVM